MPNVVGMIFAAGLGTRLVPFTLTAPKALVPVCGVPMLQRVITSMQQAGINRIVVNVHHFADRIIQFLADNNNFGSDIIISDETALLLDTGGAILHARKHFAGADAVIVHNADILTDVNIEAMVKHHLDSGNDATLLVARRHSTRQLYFDGAERLHGWANLTTGATLPHGFTPDDNYNPLAFGGVHVFSPRIIDSLERYADGRKVFSIIPFYVHNCRQLDIEGYVPSVPYKWFDIGTPEKLKAAEAGITT